MGDAVDLVQIDVEGLVDWIELFACTVKQHVLQIDLDTLYLQITQDSTLAVFVLVAKQNFPAAVEYRLLDRQVTTQANAIVQAIDADILSQQGVEKPIHRVDTCCAFTEALDQMSQRQMVEKDSAILFRFQINTAARFANTHAHVVQRKAKGFYRTIEGEQRVDNLEAEKEFGCSVTDKLITKLTGLTGTEFKIEPARFVCLDLGCFQWNGKLRQQFFVGAFVTFAVLGFGRGGKRYTGAAEHFVIVDPNVLFVETFAEFRLIQVCIRLALAFAFAGTFHGIGQFILAFVLSFNNYFLREAGRVTLD